MNRYTSYVTAIIKGHILHKNIPIFVTICVTPRCNLQCKYCYLGYYGGNSKEFTTEQLLNLIDELAQMGTKYISLNGGEALLRQDLGTIVNRIKEKNIICHLSTNALLIKKNISFIKKIDSLAISIDGARQSNDLNRGVGVYDKVLEAIEYLYRNNCKFHTHTVLTKNNKEALEEIVPLALKYKFKAQFSPLRNEDTPDKQIILGPTELRKITKKIIDYKKKGLPIFFSYKAYENLLNWPFTYDKQMTFDSLSITYRPIKCYIKRFSCHIEPDGLVYPCIVLVNKFKALNFLDIGFKKAWENLANNNCKACYNVCCNDLNLIFSFNPQAIWNAFKIVMDRVLP